MAIYGLGFRMNEHRCQQLEKLLHTEIPLSDNIGMAVHKYDGKQLELHADLEPNVNVHGVAFGGSIYSMCALSGWGLLILRLEEQGLNPRIMIAGAEIVYSKPVMQNIKASSRLSTEQDFVKFVETYKERRRARIKIPVEIRLDNGTVAARFTGEYIAFERT